MIMMINHYCYSWLKGLNYITASALWGVLFCLLFVFREGEFMCLYFLYSISHPLSPYPRTKAFTSKTNENTNTHNVWVQSTDAGMCMHMHTCVRVLARVLLLILLKSSACRRPSCLFSSVDKFTRKSPLMMREEYVSRRALSVRCGVVVGRGGRNKGRQYMEEVLPCWGLEAS